MKQFDPDNTIPAVVKTLDVLAAIADSPAGLSRNELAARFGITATTCYRILRSLEQADWIVATPDRGWELSVGVLPLVLKMHELAPFWENAREKLDELAGTTALSCKLSVRTGSAQQTLLRAEAPGPFGISGKVGVRFPLVEGSVGAALLTDASPAELRRQLELCPDDLPEKRDPRLLRNGIESVRTRGYALNATANRWRIGAMSSPVRSADGRIVAAVTLLGLPDDFQGAAEARLAKHLIACAAGFRNGLNTTKKNKT